MLTWAFLCKLALAFQAGLLIGEAINEKARPR